MITLTLDSWDDFTPEFAQTVSDLLTEKDELWEDVVGR